MMNPPIPPFSTIDASSGDNGSLIIHKVPRMPIMIDQEEADPRSVREFTGKPLHTVVDADALDGKMLQIFTSNETATDYAHSSLVERKSPVPRPQMPFGASGQALTAGVPVYGGYIDMYEHIDFDGFNWRLLEYNSLTVGNYSAVVACTGFLFWTTCRNANDTVSSIDVRVSADAVSFCSLPMLDFSGGVLWVPGDAWIPNLVPFGWNDRISSHVLWFFS